MKHVRARLFGRPLVEMLVTLFVLSGAIIVAVVYLFFTRY